MSEEYLSAAETARLVRGALARSFPSAKFYVRTDTYSMGASIQIDWMDGPSRVEVEKVAKLFESADFDGTIDLECYKEHWILPDGSVILAKHPGTTPSMGRIDPEDNPKPHPDARLVHFGADYIFCEKAHTRQTAEKVGERVHERTGWPIPQILETCWWVGGKERGNCAHFGGYGPQVDEYNRELWRQ